MNNEAKCEWWDEDGVWASSCGVAFQFNDGGPEDNAFAFCYNCGKPIDVKVKAQEEE